MSVLSRRGPLSTRGGGFLFSDTFQRADADTITDLHHAWVADAPGLTIVDGTAQIDPSENNGTDYIATPANVQASSTLHYTLTGDDAEASAALVFANDDHSLNRVTLRQATGTEWALTYAIGGELATIATGSAGSGLGDHSMTLTMVDPNHVSVTVDGQVSGPYSTGPVTLTGRFVGISAGQTDSGAGQVALTSFDTNQPSPPPQEFTLVQSAFTPDPGSAASSQTAVFADDVQPGNLVVLYVLTFPTTSTEQPSGLGATWTKVLGDAAGDSAGLDLWVGTGLTGGDTITVAASPNMENVFVAYEFAGLDGTDPSGYTGTVNRTDGSTTVQSGLTDYADGTLALGAFWTNIQVNPPSSDGITVTPINVGAWIDLFTPADQPAEDSGLFIARSTVPASNGNLNYKALTSEDVESTGIIVLIPFA